MKAKLPKTPEVKALKEIATITRLAPTRTRGPGWFAVAVLNVCDEQVERVKQAIAACKSAEVQRGSYSLTFVRF